MKWARRLGVVAVLLFVGMVLGAGLMVATSGSRSRVTFGQPRVITRIEERVEALDEQIDHFGERIPRMAPTVPPPAFREEIAPEFSWDPPPRVEVVAPRTIETSGPGWILTAVLTLVRLALNALVLLLLVILGAFLLWRHDRRPVVKRQENRA